MKKKNFFWREKELKKHTAEIKIRVLGGVPIKATFSQVCRGLLLEKKKISFWERKRAFTKKKKFFAEKTKDYCRSQFEKRKGAFFPLQTHPYNKNKVLFFSFFF